MLLCFFCIHFKIGLKITNASIFLSQHLSPNFPARDALNSSLRSKLIRRRPFAICCSCHKTHFANQNRAVAAKLKPYSSLSISQVLLLIQSCYVLGVFLKKKYFTEHYQFPKSHIKAPQKYEY